MSHPMPTSGIAEVRSYPKEILHQTGFQAKRRCRVDWADRYEWASWFFYNTDTQLYPYFTAAGLPTQSAINAIAIEPDENTRLTHEPNATSEAVYGKAILTLQYESAGFDLDNLLIEELVPRMESCAIINYVNRGGRMAAIHDTVHIPGYTVTVTYPRRSTMPSAPVYLPGLVNLDVVYMHMLPIWIAPGRLLYAGGSTTAALHYDGTTRFCVQHNMWYRGIDWNMAFDAMSGGWVFPLVPKYAATSFTPFL